MTQATETTAASKKNDKLARNGSAALGQPNADIPEGFCEIRTSYPHWKPDGCEMFPAQGMLLDHIQMPDAQEINKKTGEIVVKKWSILVIRATVATKAFSEEGTDELIDIAPGQDFGVPVSYDLTSLANVARDPNFVREVFIKVGKVTKLSGGRELRNYFKAIKPDSKVPRSQTGYFLAPTSRVAGAEAPPVSQSEYPSGL